MGYIHDDNGSGAFLVGPDANGNRYWRIEAFVGRGNSNEHIPVDLGDALDAGDRAAWISVRDTAYNQGRSAWESAAASTWGSAWTTWFSALSSARQDSIFEVFRAKGQHGIGL